MVRVYCLSRLYSTHHLPPGPPALGSTSYSAHHGTVGCIIGLVMAVAPRHLRPHHL